MKDVMVDLETYGNTPGCIILSIGAVGFCPEQMKLESEGFYNVISMASCREFFLGEDADTVSWWNRQSEDARKVIADAQNEDIALTLPDALENLNGYVSQFGGKRSVRVWGNGANFDNPILAVAYKMAGIKPAWEFWNERCYRSLKNWVPGPKLERVGTYHNALDDARSQALHAIELMTSINAAGLVWK